MDVRPHPHIGLATVTYMFAGEILHRDSLGYVQTIAPGEVNWMTAGRGIVHSERTGDIARKTGQQMHGLQVWVALPEAYEEAEPGFFHHPARELPVIRQANVSMRLIAGSAFAHTSPVRTYSPLFYLDVDMPAGSSLRVPGEYAERAVHVVTGEIRIRDREIGAYSIAVCHAAADVEIKAMSTSRLILFGGAAISERFVWWNFVSSSRERIEQAKLDWQNGRFGKVPGETEFIPLPENR
jgi:redox-sensitive bicupin YhaK (pirin superfamily)